MTATIVSLDSQMPVSGPLMISANNSSAMATILDDDLIVSIITSDNIIQDSTVVSESDEVSLRLILSDAINRDLPVTLSYIDDSGLAPSAPTVVNVLEGNTSQDFSILVRDDEIAAQSTRNIVISVVTGVGYTASTVPVTVNVIDDDVATVSISRVEDRVIEGDTIVFTITRDLATAQASSISLTLTHNGDFFSAATPTLNFGDNYEETGINLSLIARHKRDGKVYYYLNHRNTNDFADIGDRRNHNLLDDLLNGGNNTTDTQESGRHIGNDDARSVIIDGYALILPTLTEIQAFRAAENFVAPDDWFSEGEGAYWSATILPGSNDMHYRISLHNSNMASPGGDDVATDRSYVFFQVLTAQRTIIVDLPAGQMDVMVEVATIDTDDSITDGSLTAELIAVTSPIELGSTVSEVVILNNNLEVTVTGLNGESSVDVDEDSSVTLVLKVNPPVDQPRDVNLSYMNVISDAMETISITVPAGSTSQDFSIFVGNDDIAAQATRTFSVMVVEADRSYVVGASSSVTVSVLDNDTATVSISAASGPVTESTEALFEVQVDKEIATTLTVGIEFTTMGEFELNQSSAVVVIAAGETTALLTVMTIDDSEPVDYSLTATINMLTLSGSVSGVEPAISADDSSATVTILDNDAPLSITAMPASLSLVADGDSAQVKVSLNRLDAGSDEVEVSIKQEGSRLDVASSLTLRSRDEMEVSVTPTSETGMSTLTFTADDYITATVTVEITPAALPQVGLSASTELEITVGTTEALTIQVNAEEATRATLTTSIRISTIISVMAPPAPTSLTGGNTIINVTGVNQGETDLVIRVEAGGYETTEITVRVRVMPAAALRFRIKVFLEGAQ